MWDFLAVKGVLGPMMDSGATDEKNGLPSGAQGLYALRTDDTALQSGPGAPG
jgi:hypothetical protein